MEKRFVYADAAATVPTLPEALSEYEKTAREIWGNPSSQYSVGRAAKRRLDECRARMAELLGANPRRVFFTSGGTEADNWAVVSGAHFMKERFGKNKIAVSEVEHPAVINAARALEREGYALEYLPVTPDGTVDIERAAKIIDGEVGIVSVMYANNEIGTIQPIGTLEKMAHSVGAYFMTDAVQAVGSVKMSFRDTGADMMTLSGHKFGAPRGIGALILSDGCEIEPFILGGEQERGMRAGTENLPAAAAMTRALELALENFDDTERVAGLRDDIAEYIINEIPSSHINGTMKNRTYGNLSVSFDGVEGESLMLLLDSRGICVSTGSACSSGAAEPSHVITALGYGRERARGTIRISLPRTTTANDAEYIKVCISECVSRLREITHI
ncbi:MAG: cysteine desulfurase [Firmicutes bacterium]|nr:cysteine desulfurase [Bacillota bacterium]